MFGLGPLEILLIVGVIALVAGPAAIPKLFRAFQSVQEAKSKLTKKALIDTLVGDDKPADKSKTRKRKHKRG